MLWPRNTPGWFRCTKYTLLQSIRVPKQLPWENSLSRWPLTYKPKTEGKSLPEVVMKDTNEASMESLSSTAYSKRTTFSFNAVVLVVQRTKVGELGLFWDLYAIGPRHINPFITGDHS